ncbi:hypothetical protein [Desulfitobacterium metallireducens]|uniref:Membrane protein n=1 Tax=Desulfitobacterium metallireducens DSM 15288 TaxID=871968 RepID=W0EC94_9FIRM|nr:hypothetical protein [Desulfitobacterium metallireducens]AHF06661.1 membrane protein [Desulfitobacterium metallireducens DSM 15288]
MNQGASQEPVRTLKSWYFGLFMFAFYLFWGGYFTDLSVASQIVFNFAVFYPAGFLAGYFSKRSRLRDVFLSGFLFNSLTYGLAFAGGQTVKLGYVGVDFITMILWIYIGIFVGKRTAN